MKLKSLCGIAVIILALAVTVQGQTSTWKGFRGNNTDGIANSNGQLNTDWNAKAPTEIFKFETGAGFPEVAVDEEKFYLHGVDTIRKEELLIAYDLETGKEQWRTLTDSMYFEDDGWGHGPRSTPAIDEKNIYVFTAFGKLKAIDKKSGKELWMRDAMNEFNAQIPRWAFSSSPLLVDDMVIQETGGDENRALTAFNKTNGKTIWSNGTGVAGYNSPQLMNINGEDQIIAVHDTVLNAYNKKGDMLWSYRMPIQGFTAVPVFIAPNKIFCNTVSRVGGFMIEINNNEIKELYQSKVIQNNWSSSVYHDGYIYGFARARLMCMDAETGEAKWNMRGYGKGSIILVDDHLVMLSDAGEMVLVEATPEAFTLKGSVQALEGKSWTAPAFVNGRIYVRNLTHFACYEITK